MKTIKYNTLRILGNPLRQSLSYIIIDKSKQTEYDYCKFVRMFR